MSILRQHTQSALTGKSAAKHVGFTLVELVVVIVILGVLAVTALPRFLNLGSDAKVASLRNIAGQIESMTQLVQAKARVQGLRPLDVNPNAQQTELIVDFGFASVELMFSNLCPEASGELADSIDMIEFMNISLNEGLSTRVDNRYYLIGYDVPSSGQPSNQGCYLVYDSFAEPNCTVELVTSDC